MAGRWSLLNMFFMWFFATPTEAEGAQEPTSAQNRQVDEPSLFLVVRHLLLATFVEGPFCRRAALPHPWRERCQVLGPRLDTFVCVSVGKDRSTT